MHFISHSTAAYAALGPLSAIGVISYLISGKAIFLVTGDKNQSSLSNSKSTKSRNFLQGFKNSWQKFIDKSHPDNYVVQGLEFLIGLIFAIACFKMFQISFLGLCIAFILMPIFHKFGWKSRIARTVAHLPFIFIMFGIFMASMSLIGLQSMFFGYGFHF